MCNAHNLREAVAAFEQDGHFWAGELIRFLNKAERTTDIARRLGRERLPPRLLAKFDGGSSASSQEGRNTALVFRTTSRRGRASAARSNVA